MRLKITLDNKRGSSIPINYQQYLTPSIYSLVSEGDKEYADYLHNHGYKIGTNRAFKFFTYSGIISPKRRVINQNLQLLSDELNWFISSVKEEFIQNVVSGIMTTGEIRIASVVYPVTDVSMIQTPHFYNTTTQKFTCMSPIVATVKTKDNEITYLRPFDFNFSTQVQKNTLNKYVSVYGKPPTDSRLSLILDREYLQKKRGTKMINYKGINVVGVFCPFVANGSSEMIKLAYEVGFGEKNSAGFGMAELTD